MGPVLLTEEVDLFRRRLGTGKETYASCAVRSYPSVRSREMLNGFDLELAMSRLTNVRMSNYSLLERSAMLSQSTPMKYREIGNMARERSAVRDRKVRIRGIAGIGTAIELIPK